MAARTFETLVNDFIHEYGIGGSGPLVNQSGQTEAVVGQSGNLARAVRWIRDANDSINNLWNDWDFLWFEWSKTNGIALSSDAPIMPTVAVDTYKPRRWDRGSFYIDRTAATWSQLSWLDWDEFRDTFKLGTQTASRPTVISMKPDGTLITSVIANAAYDFYGRGWKEPNRLTIDASVPDIPEVFDRIIIARAAIYYADKEDAPEILEGANSEYIDILDKLQSSQLEAFRYDRMSSQDIEFEVAIPGQESLYPTR